MHTIYTNKPEEAKGVFGVQVDDPQSADIILIVIPDDPSIGDAVNIMEWSFDENDWDAPVYFGSTKYASPQLVTAVAGRAAVKKLPDVIKHINNSYFLSEEVDMYYVVTETLHIAGKNAPNKEDMDFLLKAIDAAFKKHSPWTIAVTLHDFLREGKIITAFKFNELLHSYAEMYPALGQSDKVWLNTGSAYLSVVAKFGITEQPSEDTEKYTMLRLFQPYVADRWTRLKEARAELRGLAGC